MNLVKRVGLSPVEARACVQYVRHGRQVDVAKRLGLSQGYVSRILSRVSRRHPQLAPLLNN